MCEYHFFFDKLNPFFIKKAIIYFFIIFLLIDFKFLMSPICIACFCLFLFTINFKFIYLFMYRKIKMANGKFNVISKTKNIHDNKETCQSLQFFPLDRDRKKER